MTPDPIQKIKCRDTIQSLYVSVHLLACGLQNGEVKNNAYLIMSSSEIILNNLGSTVVSFEELLARSVNRS